MRILLGSLLLLTACQVYNSASRDKLLYGSSVDPESNFGKATQVISSRCISCHAIFGSFQTEADWRNAGYVVAGSLAGSSVYYRLNGAGLGGGQENMPQNAVLTNQELMYIRTWILNM